jgi:hypothetical protein
MMGMSKITLVFFAATLFLSFACQEEKVAEPTSFESTETVKVYESPLGEGVDWNRELELVGSTEVLEKAAAALGTDSVALREVIKIEVDVSNRQIRIVSVHAEEEISRKFARAYADACVTRRIELESNLIRMKLADLETQFEEESSELDLDRWGVSDLSGDAQKRALELDRMTYEKAKKDLEKDPVEAGALNGDILFRKKVGK